MDPFEAPATDSAMNPVRNQAASNLYRGAAAAIGLGLFQFCCNPFFLVTFAAGGASMNALRQPRWMRISLEEDYPEQAGMISMGAGVVGLLLVVLRVLVTVLAIVGRAAAA